MQPRDKIPVLCPGRPARGSKMSLAKTSDLDQAAREFERETAEDGEEEEEELGMEEPSEEEV